MTGPTKAKEPQVDGRKFNQGQAKIALDWQQLEAVARVGATLRDAAEILVVSEDTIERRIREHYDMTFVQYRNQKMAYRRAKILQKQYEVAMAGSERMLQWLGKQWCGQSDKQELGLYQGQAQGEEKGIAIKFVGHDDVDEDGNLIEESAND